MRYGPAPFLTHLLTMFFWLHYASASPHGQWEEDRVRLYVWQIPEIFGEMFFKRARQCNYPLAIQHGVAINRVWNRIAIPYTCLR